MRPLPAGRVWAPVLLLLAAASLAAGACLKVTGETSPYAAKQPEVKPDRTDCGEVLGTAFRSDSERRWFAENCSVWPPVAVPQTGPPPVRSAIQEPGCAAMRGRPYQSEAERQWFLTNCQGQAVVAAAPAASQGGQPPPAPPVQAGDRANCDEIRGTAYRSNAERSWYVRGCLGPTVSAAPSGPDRTSCDQIRGTEYRSTTEREWFIRNCQNPPPAQVQPELPPVVPPVPG